MQGYNSHGFSAHWDHKQGSNKSNDSREWKSLELGILTRWYDLPPRVKLAVEIIKFKEMRELGFQSGLIFMSRCWEHETTKLCTNHQADHMSSIS